MEPSGCRMKWSILSWCLRRTSICLLTAAILFQGCGIMVESSSPLDSGLEHVSFSPPKPESWVLKNGITVLYLPDKELPFVRGALYIPGGDIWEEEDQSGSVSMMGQLMRRGGAGELSADELDEVLEKLSATVSSGFGDEFGTVGFSCLRQDFDEVFGLFIDVLRRPRFEDDRFALLKLQKLERIRRRKDDPETISSLALATLLYGDTPYGRVASSETVAKIDRAAVLGAYEKFVSPHGAIFTVTGDISREKIEETLNSHLADWGVAGEKVVTPPPVNDSEGGKIVFIDGPFTQATVVAAQLGVPRMTEDQYAIKVFNRIFGVGLGTSRLYERVRSDLGLAYSVYGYISPGIVKGTNSIHLQTKASSAGVGLVESLRALMRLREEPPAQLELAERKLAAINSFVFANDSSDSTLQRQALFRLYGYPLDYDSNYIENIDDVSARDILRVAQSRWDPSKLVIVVVGPKEALESILASKEQLGEIIGEIEIVEADFDERLKIN